MTDADGAGVRPRVADDAEPGAGASPAAAGDGAPAAGDGGPGADVGCVKGTASATDGGPGADVGRVKGTASATAREGGAGSIHERWIAFVVTEDRSGVLAAMAETFSSRGVSFESFNTLRVSDGVGVMSIIFRGSARLARVLARTLERLAVTREVRLVRASDPGVRAVAVVADADGVSRIVSGSLAEVESALAEARAAGGALESLTVLPPV